VKNLVLSLKEIMSLGKKAVGKRGDSIPDVGQGKQFLEGRGIRALLKDDDVAMMDEEGMCHRKIAGFDVSKSIIEELVLLPRRPIEWGDLEDEGDSWRKRAMGRGNPRRCSLILRSI
jgi:hypothetical protein